MRRESLPTTALRTMRSKGSFLVGKLVLSVLPPEGIGEISDGYHSFNELYEHRYALFLSLMSFLPGQSWYSSCHDDGSSYDGWFIAGIGLPPIGAPITYHLPNRLLGKVKQTGAMFLETAPKWDGHTPDDVVERLYNFLNY